MLASLQILLLFGAVSLHGLPYTVNVQPGVELVGDTDVGKTSYFHVNVPYNALTMKVVLSRSAGDPVLMLSKTDYPEAAVAEESESGREFPAPSTELWDKSAWFHANKTSTVWVTNEKSVAFDQRLTPGNWTVAVTNWPYWMQEKAQWKILLTMEYTPVPLGVGEKGSLGPKTKGKHGGAVKTSSLPPCNGTGNEQPMTNGAADFNPPKFDRPLRDESSYSLTRRQRKFDMVYWAKSGTDRDFCTPDPECVAADTDLKVVWKCPEHERTDSAWIGLFKRDSCIRDNKCYLTYKTIGKESTSEVGPWGGSEVFDWKATGKTWWHSLNTQFMADGGIYEFRFFRDDKSYKAAVSSLVFVPTEVCAPYNTSCPKSGKAPKLSNGNITDYLKSEQPVFGDDWEEVDVYDASVNVTDTEVRRLKAEVKFLKNKVNMTQSVLKLLEDKTEDQTGSQSNASSSSPASSSSNVSSSSPACGKSASKEKQKEIMIKQLKKEIAKVPSSDDLDPPVVLQTKGVSSCRTDLLPNGVPWPCFLPDDTVVVPNEETVRVNFSPVMNYAQMESEKYLQELAQIDNHIEDIRGMEAGIAMSGVAAVGRYSYYSIRVPEGATSLKVTMNKKGGDPILLLKEHHKPSLNLINDEDIVHPSQPDNGMADLNSWRLASKEASLSVSGAQLKPGRWIVAVHNWPYSIEQIAKFTLYYTIETKPPPAAQPGLEEPKVAVQVDHTPVESTAPSLKSAATIPEAVSMAAAGAKRTPGQDPKKKPDSPPCVERGNDLVVKWETLTPWSSQDAWVGLFKRGRTAKCPNPDDCPLVWKPLGDAAAPSGKVALSWGSPARWSMQMEPQVKLGQPYEIRVFPNKIRKPAGSSIVFTFEEDCTGVFKVMETAAAAAVQLVGTNTSTSTSFTNNISAANAVSMASSAVKLPSGWLGETVSSTTTTVATTTTSTTSSVNYVVIPAKWTSTTKSVTVPTSTTTSTETTTTPTTTSLTTTTATTTTTANTTTTTTITEAITTTPMVEQVKETEVPKVGQREQALHYLEEHKDDLHEPVLSSQPFDAHVLGPWQGIIPSNMGPSKGYGAAGMWGF